MNRRLWRRRTVVRQPHVYAGDLIADHRGDDRCTLCRLPQRHPTHDLPDTADAMEESVEKIDATVQPINLNKDSCIQVRLANQTTACVEVSLQWNIDQHANANELWQRYRGKDDDVVANVGNNVIARELRNALGLVFEHYNPLAVLSGEQSNTTSDDLARQALEKMRAGVDAGIVIDKLTIPLGGIHYDATTQDKLNGYAQALADTQIATQNKLTAEQQKAANDLLAAASSNDPGVMYQNCLNLLKDLAAKGQLGNLPPTFNCGDASTPVIVGQR